MKFFQFKQTMAVGIMAVAFLASCSDDDDKPETGVPVANDFHIALANGSGSSSATVVQGLPDLSQGSINSSKGHQLESSRTARIFTSTDGVYLYSLNYTVGSIEKLVYLGNDKYQRVGPVFNASNLLGPTAIRMTKLSDKEASVHFVKATATFDKDEEYLGHSMELSLGLLDLEAMRMREGYQSSLKMKLDEELALQGYYISRIDCPVVSGSKIYYGAAVSKYNTSTNKSDATDKTFTLVLDYPSLTKPTVILTDMVSGGTNGYRTQTQYTNEAGEILQMVSGNNAKTGKEEVHIIKIVNGKYTNYDLNVSELLNKPTKSNGWFYAGNGIGYLPYEDLTTESKVIGVDPQGKETKSAMWKLARLDFNKGSVVDLNVPSDLWLTQYQTSVVRDGIFYIALSPVGKPGNIYLFDVNSESPDGKLGASLSDTGHDQYFIGIY